MSTSNLNRSVMKAKKGKEKNETREKKERKRTEIATEGPSFSTIHSLSDLIPNSTRVRLLASCCAQSATALAICSARSGSVNGYDRDLNLLCLQQTLWEPAVVCTRCLVDLELSGKLLASRESMWRLSK